jgi:hypothetical protein
MSRSEYNSDRPSRGQFHLAASFAALASEIRVARKCIRAQAESRASAQRRLEFS